MRQWICIVWLMFACVAHAKDSSGQDSARILARQVGQLIDHLQTAGDSGTYYVTLAKVMRVAMQCDRYDATPNARGKVKCKFRSNHRKALEPLCGQLVSGAHFFDALGQNQESLDCLTTYLAIGNSQLFNSYQLADAGWAAWKSAQLAYHEADYVLADRMADMALTDNDYAQLAAEVKIRCMRETMREPIDSARYLIALLELHDKAPENQGYFKMLMDYFLLHGHESDMESFAIDETNKDSTNKMAWAFLGEIKMKRKDWQSAIDAFRRATALDPDFVEAMYNLGICYSAKVRSSVDAQAAALPDTCRMMLTEARKCLETVRRHPDNASLDWVKPLYQVYLLLEENEKADELKPQLILGKNVEKDN